MNRLQTTFTAVCMASTVGTGLANSDEETRPFPWHRTVEKERPQLNEETRRLIGAYRSNPTRENLRALKKQVEINYDKVIARKKAKLLELKQTAKHASKVREMQEIVDEVVREKKNRIEQSVLRFTDPRLHPGSRRSSDGFLPVIGAAPNVSIAYTPVTNEDYARFIEATGRKAPGNWIRGIMPAGKERHPVVHVSYGDAVAYCQWLSAKDENAVYRLPTAGEWELAAGHMPKDADFNCCGRQETTPVDAYAQTLAACGAIDMWGNCWEWTSTPIVPSRGKERSRNQLMALKGGSWRSPRLSCRTEQKVEGRAASTRSEDVGFRIVREK